MNPSRDELRRVMSALGRKGAAATNKKLTPDQLSEKMRRAVKARWAKRNAEQNGAAPKSAGGTKSKRTTKARAKE